MNNNLSKSSKSSKDPNYTIGISGRKVFAKGNKIGRMKKRGYKLLDLTKAAMQYDRTHDVTILQHYINEVMKSNKLLQDFINKYVPTRTELTGEGGGPITYKEYFPALDPENKEEK